MSKVYQVKFLWDKWTLSHPLYFTHCFSLGVYNRFEKWTWILTLEILSIVNPRNFFTLTPFTSSFIKIKQITDKKGTFLESLSFYGWVRLIFLPSRSIGLFTSMYVSILFLKFSFVEWTRVRSLYMLLYTIVFVSLIVLVSKLIGRQEPHLGNIRLHSTNWINSKIKE